MQEKYLIDETLVVYLDRQNYEHDAQLFQFLEDGRKINGILSKHEKRKHIFYMPFVSRERLGGFFFYRFKNNYLSDFFRRANPILEAKEKAYDRFIISSLYVEKYCKLGFFIRFLHRWELMDLFICGNTQKSEKIQREKGRKIEPDEIIPIETCEIALIARKKNLTIVSFNDDFEYLKRIDKKKKTPIKFIPATELLKDYLRGN